jgi:hypothetical protein
VLPLKPKVGRQLTCWHAQEPLQRRAIALGRIPAGGRGRLKGAKRPCCQVPLLELTFEIPGAAPNPVVRCAGIELTASDPAAAAQHAVRTIAISWGFGAREELTMSDALERV